MIPPYFIVKKYVLISLIFATIAVYIFFIISFAGKMNNEEIKQASEPLGGAFKPLANPFVMGVSSQFLCLN